MESPKTPQSKFKRNKISYCDNINNEFASRITDLFSSMYEVISTEPISKMRQEKCITPQKKCKNNQNPTFESALWDYRLKKFLNEQDQIESDVINQFNEKLSQIENILNGPAADLDIVFAPDLAERPSIPYYLQNKHQEDQFEKEEKDARSHHHGIGIEEYQKQYAIRLRKQNQISSERKAKRAKRMADLEKSYYSERDARLSAIFSPNKPKNPTQI